MSDKLPNGTFVKSNWIFNMKEGISRFLKWPEFLRPQDSRADKYER